MYSMKLQWKEFNVNLTAMRDFAKNQSPDCTGSDANYVFEIHFLNEPSDDVKAAIQAKWDGLDESSPEVTSYKSQAQMDAEEAADKAAKIASATSKLEALGLSAEEIAALRG